MAAQQSCDFVHCQTHALFKLPRSEGLRHAGNHLLPLSGADVCVDSPVGDDIDGMLCKQNIDKHTVVVLCVPHAQLAEHHEGALARGRIAQQVAPRETTFRTQAYLSGVLLFAGGNAGGQPLQGDVGEHAAHELVVPAVPQETGNCPKDGKKP